MNVLRIEINHAAVAQLLKSPGVQADLERRARRIAAAAGPGNEVDVAIGRTRARATVRTATTEARVAEATRRALTTAVDAGRG